MEIITQEQILSPQNNPQLQQGAVLSGPVSLLKQAFNVYKKKIGVILGIEIVPTLVMVALSVVFAGSAMLFAISELGSMLGVVGMIAAIFLFVVVIVVIQTWSQTALLYAIKDGLENIGVMESFRRGWHKILSFWWVSVLFMAVILGGTLLLVVPGIIVAVFVSLSVYVVVAEDEKGMAALLKSREYVRGRWWGVFGRLLFLFAFSMIVSWILAFVVALLNVPLIATPIINLVSLLFLTPLYVIYLFLMYGNLKSLRGDLSAAPVGKKTTFVVLAILGIVGVLVLPATIMLASLNGARGKAYDARRNADIKQIRWALVLYQDKSGGIFPDSLDVLIPEYLEKAPTDPKTNMPYPYQATSGGRDYKICAQLEKGGENCRTNRTK